GKDKGLTEALVEPVGNIAGEFDMLPLVRADGNEMGIVQDDIGGLEDWIGEQGGADTFFFATRFVLELGHATEFTKTGDGLEDPAEFRVLVYIGLHKENAMFGINTGGEDGVGDTGNVLHHGFAGDIERERMQ